VADVLCARGCTRASIRDISRSTGVSVAGLYYYFSSKDELLYLIQGHALETIRARAVGRIKRSVCSGLEMPLAKGLALEHELQFDLFKSDDTYEGLKAYVDRRTPKFKAG
jgi:AcrR family transcriptional regulator